MRMPDLLRAPFVWTFLLAQAAGVLWLLGGSGEVDAAAYASSVVVSGALWLFANLVRDSMPPAVLRWLNGVVAVLLVGAMPFAHEPIRRLAWRTAADMAPGIEDAATAARLELTVVSLSVAGLIILAAAVFGLWLLWSRARPVPLAPPMRRRVLVGALATLVCASSAAAPAASCTRLAPDAALVIALVQSPASPLAHAAVPCRRG